MKNTRTWIYDVMAAAGWTAIAVGIGLWSLPAGIIAAGVGLLTAGVLGASLRGGNKNG
jgi:hypothetical protein